MWRRLNFTRYYVIANKALDYWLPDMLMHPFNISTVSKFQTIQYIFACDFLNPLSDVQLWNYDV